MKTPTIYEIKRTTLTASPHFFSLVTMRFFGQTLKDFHVAKSPQGNIYIYARRGWGNLWGWTFRQYKDNDLLPCPAVHGLEEIKTYIREH